MIKRYLENYKTFTCIAADCPATCCSGWLIEIDEKSIDRYKSLSKENNDFKENVDFAEECFKQKENKDCAFLRADGLCKMQKEYGEAMLCYTCDMYPRHIEEFPNVREYSLSASCPAVAKQIVENTNYLSYLTEEDDEKDAYEEEEYAQFNDALYGKLLEIRETIIDILKTENKKFEEKAAVIDNCMKKVQEDLDDGFLDGCEKAFEKIDGEPSKTTLKDYVDDLKLMNSLEPLREDFVKWVNKAIDYFSKNRDEEKFQEFEDDISDLDQIKTNIALYFIFTYFCGAAYDDYVYSAARMSIFAVRVVTVLAFKNWIENGNACVSEILYKFCRELENSNDNLITIRQELDETYYQ